MGIGMCRVWFLAGKRPPFWEWKLGITEERHFGSENCGYHPCAKNVFVEIWSLEFLSHRKQFSLMFDQHRMGVVTFADPNSVQIAVETLRDVDVGDRCLREKMRLEDVGCHNFNGSSISNRRNLPTNGFCRFVLVNQGGRAVATQYVNLRLPDYQ